MSSAKRFKWKLFKAELHDDDNAFNLVEDQQTERVSRLLPIVLADGFPTVLLNFRSFSCELTFRFEKRSKLFQCYWNWNQFSGCLSPFSYRYA